MTIFQVKNKLENKLLIYFHYPQLIALAWNPPYLNIKETVTKSLSHQFNLIKTKG